MPRTASRRPKSASCTRAFRAPDHRRLEIAFRNCEQSCSEFRSVRRLICAVQIGEWRIDEVRMISASPTLCAIIAAKDAAATIQRAIRSALREPQVAEVVVVDDGSTDGTAQKSREADDGSGRLKVHRLDRNRGPAFARNHAISNSAAPLIAILDADDFFLK